MQGTNGDQYIDNATKSALLWVLWRHQGAHSSIGQAVRKMLGKEQYDRLSNEEIDLARLVSVGKTKTHKALEMALKFAEDATEHYSFMNDEVCQSYRDSWQQGLNVSRELRAAIENK